MLPTGVGRFSILGGDGGGGGGGQALVLTYYKWDHWGHKPFKIIGGCLAPKPHPLAPTPMLHVPIHFEISPERESIPCTSY